MKITINGNTLAELVHEYKLLAKQLGIEVLDVADQQTLLPLELKVSEIESEKKGRGRPKKAAATEESTAESVTVFDEPTEAPAPAAPAPTAPAATLIAHATRAEAEKALKDTYYKDKAIAVAVLGQFNAKSFSMLQENQYGEFVKACLKAVA